MFCRCFKVFLLWRSFLHPGSPKCLACAGSRGCSTKDAADSSIHFPIQHLVVCPFLNTEGWGCVSFYFILVPSEVAWHSLFRRGEGKETRVRLLFLSYRSVSGQWARLCLLMCIQPLPCINHVSISSPFGGKNAFLLRIVIIRCSVLVYTGLRKCYTNALSTQEWIPAIICSLKHDRLHQKW